MKKIQQKKSLLISGGKVHDGITKRTIRHDILIVDGKIAKIAENIKAPAGCEIFDASGREVYPGLVEAHCHLGVCGYAIEYPGNDVNERNSSVIPQLNAIDGINPFDPCFQVAAAAGVTCVGTGPGSANVVGGTFAVIKTVGKRVDDMVVKPVAAMKCAFGENPKKTYKEKGISTRMTTAALLRELLQKSVEYDEKLCAAGDNVEKKPTFDAKLHAMLPVIRREIPLKIHVHQANDIFTAIRITREFHLRFTLEHCTEGAMIAEELAKENIPVAIGPSFGFATKPELMQKGFHTPGILQKAGCQVSIITDHPVTPQEYLSLMAGLAAKAGMDRFAALQAITINPARHLGIEDRVGSIEVGKDGDIVIADGDILSSETKVIAVFIEGKKVVRQKTEFDLPLNIDTEEP